MWKSFFGSVRLPKTPLYGYFVSFLWAFCLCILRISFTFANNIFHSTVMSRSSHSHTTNPPEGQVIITRARISGISEVMMNEEVRRTNLQIAQDILRQIEEASKDGSVEIIFADDIRKYIALLQEEGLSPLVIDSRLQIRLPLYELTLDLPPLAKALYMLYMRHPEGLYRKQIADCREELLWLYSACLGRRVDSDMRRTIDHLTDFSTKNADKQMSLINRSFRRALADKADHYIPVSAKRGERKCLDFSRVSFHLPSFLNSPFSSPVSTSTPSPIPPIQSSK